MSERKKAKKLSPQKARTHKAICSLREDNTETENGTLWIDVGHVLIVDQRRGEPSHGSVSLPRAEFDRLVAWYLREQEIR